MQFLVLASGKGNRLKKYTQKKPKCLVKISNYRIIDYIKINFKYFKEVIIVAGYKKNIIKKEFIKQKIIINKIYYKSNMVHSLFCSKNFINSDVIISYSDIIFSPEIIKKMIKIKKTHIPINQSWLKIWLKRMNKKKVLEDAETLKIKSKFVISLGDRLIDKLPKFQFMGLIRINLKDFNKLFIFYKSLKNKKIDMTRFLDLAIKNKIISLSYFKTSKFWFEIDNTNDLNVLKKSKVLNKNLNKLLKDRLST